MVKDAMNDICVKKYRNYRIYLHNFSKFDGFFLLKYLSNIGFCDPIIHKGKIISVQFTYKNYTVYFKDSYLLLPASLHSLSKSFNVKSPKGIFPYLVSMNYKSTIVPEIKYFSNITLEEYNNYKDQYKNKIWNFKAESIKYCQLDCLSLYQVLIKFNKLIFDRFSLAINKYPTLPSLSFAIFRTHYNKEEKIHMLSGNIYNDIKKSYTGGAVDMHLPINENLHGEQIYAYDVNSLYPFVMHKYKLPIGSPTYFKGNIFKLDPDAFGFFFL